jgi:uncharacterized protein with PIN domain
VNKFSHKDKKQDTAIVIPAPSDEEWKSMLEMSEKLGIKPPKREPMRLCPDCKVPIFDIPVEDCACKRPEFYTDDKMNELFQKHLKKQE